MLAACGAMKISFPLLSLRNTAFAYFGISVVHMILSRSISSLRGKWIDCPSKHVDEIYPVPEIAKEDQDSDYIPWPLPKMSWSLRLKLVKDQLKMLKLKY